MNNWKRFCELGMSFSAAAENEMTQGHGHPITAACGAHGKAPSLGVAGNVLSGDMLTQVRVALGMQRSLDNVAYRGISREPFRPPPPSPRASLFWVTVEGARMLGQLDRIGNPAVGKQADLVLIRADDLNMFTVHCRVKHGGDADHAGQYRRDGGRALKEAFYGSWSMG